MISKTKTCRGRGKFSSFGCLAEKKIWAHGLCQWCHRAASIELSRAKPITKSVRQKKAAYKRKPTGYLAMFKEIWNERPHISQISGQPLLPAGHPMWHFQFSHLLESPYKGYGFPLRKDNVFLCLPAEHTVYGEQTDKARSDCRYDWVFEKREELKAEYRKLQGLSTQ